MKKTDHSHKHFDDVKLKFDINCDNANDDNEFDIAVSTTLKGKTNLFLLINYSAKNPNENWKRVDHFDN